MDAYQWTVGYHDGTIVEQIRNGEDIGAWKDVDPEQVQWISLEPRDPAMPLHGVRVPDGARAIFTWRKTQTLDLSTGEVTVHPSLTVAGWEKDGKGSYLFVDHLGNAMLSDDFDALP